MNILSNRYSSYLNTSNEIESSEFSESKNDSINDNQQDGQKLVLKWLKSKSIRCTDISNLDTISFFSEVCVCCYIIIYNLK